MIRAMGWSQRSNRRYEHRAIEQRGSIYGAMVQDGMVRDGGMANDEDDQYVTHRREGRKGF